MTKVLTQVWIDVGYQLFALEGPQGLKVEVISRKVQKSKSSFYHHFADTDVFTEILLQHHLHRSKIIAVLEAQCQSIIPDLVQVLVEVKTDILFNRQLRIHRNEALFDACLQKSDAVLTPSFMALWAKELQLEHNARLAEDFFYHAMENFYLQLTPENIQEAWLTAYFEKLKALVRDFLRPA